MIGSVGLVYLREHSRQILLRPFMTTAILHGPLDAESSSQEAERATTLSFEMAIARNSGHGVRSCTYP